MCTIPGIRSKLHKKGRSEVNVFANNELVYRRFREAGTRADWEDKSVSTNIFPLNNDSYNRSWESNPDDVLLNINATGVEQHFHTWGIVSLSCALLLTEKFPLRGTPKQYQITPEHRPEECMYPHTELIIYDCTTAIRIADKPKSIKAAIRLMLYEKMNIVKEYIPLQL